MLQAQAGKCASEDLVEALLMIARFNFLSARAAEGLEPSRMAVAVARDMQSLGLQRKAQTFRGALLTDTGNMPEAMECFADALNLARELKDVTAEATVWNLLGVLLISSSLHSDAVACLDRSVQLCDARPELASVKAAALINGAIAALHQKDFAKSYQHCREALASCSAPQTPDKQYERAAIEAIFVRVLLALKDVERARNMQRWRGASLTCQASRAPRSRRKRLQDWPKLRLMRRTSA
jgi:tetratricopeptide (TPR) repeat protein